MEWKEARYATALRGYIASPGFSEFKVNEELYHLENKRDMTSPVELVFAGLSNAVLELKKLIRLALQEVVDWSVSNPNEVNPPALVEMLSCAFDDGSLIAKNFDQSLQVISDKQINCIENRRERLLSEICHSNSVQSALRRILPSNEYAIAKDRLTPLTQYLGGIQAWLNTSAYVHKRPVQRAEHQLVATFSK